MGFFYARSMIVSTLAVVICLSGCAEHTTARLDAVEWLTKVLYFFLVVFLSPLLALAIYGIYIKSKWGLVLNDLREEVIPSRGEIVPIMNPEVYFRPLTIRKYTPEDFARCVELHRCDEGKSVPVGYHDMFEQWLMDESVAVVLAESGGLVVACGGMSYMQPSISVGFSFGIVDVTRHGEGIGTTLLYARMALLESAPTGCHVFMEVTEWSSDFFRRHGFQGYRVYRDDRGTTMGSVYRLITRGHIYQWKRQLQAAGVVLPEGLTIPTRPQDSKKKVVFVRSQ